jgi:N-acetylmuramate 1-kinase
MTTQPKAIPEQVSTWVRAWLSSTPSSLELLAGDGSPRQFFRVKKDQKTYVVLFDPLWAFSKDYAVHQHFLSDSKIPVPSFLKEDPAAGMLAMEDLGDELLQLRIQAEPHRRMAWLEEAARLLSALHCRTFPVPASLPVSTRRFDAKKYGEEMAFTFEHLHEKFLGFAPLSAADKERVDRFCRAIERFGPDVFCHRDYHCRNLLVRDGRLFMIDFQDARLGGPHYDLASLVFDAYVEISDADRARLYSVYKEGLKGSALDRKIDWSRFEPELEAVAFQRVVKAAGSFASFFNRYGKSTHLPYLLPALTSAERLASRMKGELAEAGEVFPLSRWKQAVEKRR